jgi:hypothetical protein
LYLPFGVRSTDYILSVKENQKGLYEDIREYFEGMESGEIREAPEDTYGRGAKRKGTGGLSGVKSGPWRDLSGLRAVKRGWF